MSKILDPVALWQDLHQIPELAMQEVKTSAYVAKTLEDLGIPVTRNVGGTGVVGYIRGEEPGPVLMLRADMDALPFTIDGKECAIHACGHDSHTAMLLAAASRLVGTIKKGAVKLVFQPAEENITGATAMIKDGVLDDVDYALGAHIRPIQDVPAGQICAGVMHSASLTTFVEIEGRSAHAARPHLGINAIDVGTAVVQAVQAIWLNPAGVWSMKCTQFHADAGATNTVPPHASLTFDCRAGTNALADELRAAFKRAVENTAAAFGAKAVVTERGSCPAAEYDEDFKAMVAESIVSLFGKEALAKDCGGGGEDFHNFKMAKPSIKAAYFGVGVGATPGLHAANMSFDPKYLENGVKVFVDMTHRVLGCRVRFVIGAKV